MTNKLLLPLLLCGATVTAVAGAFPESDHPAMRDPSKANLTAPAAFKAKFETTKGNVVFECTREWAPNGVDRFYNLVKIGFFHDVALFRVAKGFVVQWGIHGNPEVSRHWRDANIPVDPVDKSNTRGRLTYAMAGSPTTRSTQLFINFGNNSSLDAQGFAPICEVVEGMDVAESFFGEYGEDVTSQQGPIQTQGNAYLRQAWPKLDYIKTTSIVSEGAAAAKSADQAAPAKAEPKEEEGSSTLLYVVVAVLLAGGVWYVVRGGSQEDEEPEDEPKQRERPRKKRSSAAEAPSPRRPAGSAAVAKKKGKKKKLAGGAKATGATEREAGSIKKKKRTRPI